MLQPKMDSASLVAFVQVSESGSFSQAAEQMFLTQSAVSKRVALLEQQLDTRLFDRIGRQVSLTEAGRTLLPQARDILHALEDAARSLQNLSGHVSGKLSLAASHHISLHRLPPVLRAYTQRFPQVALNLRFDESEIAYEGVLKGDLELALITLAPQSDPRIHSETLWVDSLQYVVASDHPLAQLSKPDLSALNRYPALLPAPDTFTYQLVQKQLARLGLEPNLGMSTNYLDTIRMMVRIGLGWSLLPESMIDSGLTRLPITDRPIHRPLGLIYHRDRTLTNAARELVKMLRDTCPPPASDSR
ncbi:LysR family transcriptional regulator [Marinobacterium zhoushanense]|uniref:LysR family transcriptional regulator n=1 Tax=Marinobacterium zhoushanense TaxID=1679163 RepID=A0ABQ1K8S7_9GAMM|nr:LysR family transcriptional regulator [Marinobacterium zhoushanense]GGB90393.1 LysR family transcriptional regulator [Marinobacterium zhoushanense]